jgi:hypothetical protein
MQPASAATKSKKWNVQENIANDLSLQQFLLEKARAASSDEAELVGVALTRVLYEYEETPALLHFAVASDVQNYGMKRCCYSLWLKTSFHLSSKSATKTKERHYRTHAPDDQ